MTLVAPEVTGKSLAELLAGLAEPAPAVDLRVADLTLDSRRVRPGSLFLATRGQRRHGLAFAAEAVRRGAVAVAWEPAPGVVPPELPVPLVAVPRLAQRAGIIADRFFDAPSAALALIGITGTNGKSSTAHYIAHALQQGGEPVGIIGTLGAGLFGAERAATHTTPDAVELHRALADIRAGGAGRAVMEVSSHALDQARVAGVRYDFAVFTNLSRDHLDYHGDMTSYAACKRMLFSWPGLQAGAINADDPFGATWLEELADDLALTAFSASGQHLQLPTLSAHDVQAGPAGLRFRLVAPEGEAEVRSPLLGRFNVDNLLAAATALRWLGLPLADIAARLGRVTPVAGRMERVGEGAPLAVVDYAHTPDALALALSSLREHVPGRLICVFGCGGERDSGKRPLMGQVAERLADRVIVTDDNPRGEDPERIVADILSGMADRDAVQVERDRAAAIRQALDLAGPQDAVLVAGKGHEDYQLVGDERRPFSDRACVARWFAEAGR